MLLLKTSPRLTIPLRVAIPVLFVFIILSLFPIHDSLAVFHSNIIGAFRLLLLGLPIIFVALLSFIINFLTAIILAMGGLALQFAMVITGTMKLTSGGIVDIGWTITRDFVNLLFILVLIAIALATILGVEQYAVKKTLPKLLLALLFINFSKVIIGVGIDIVHIIARVFLDPVSSSNLAAQFLTSTGAFIEFFKQLWEASTTGFTEMFSVVLQFMIQMLLGAIFNVFLAFVLLVMALVLIARIVIIWILVIISPLTIAAATLPATAGHFTTWKKQIIQWVVLILPVSFFIYLGFAFLQSGVPAFTDTLQELGPELKDTLNLPGPFEDFVTIIFALFKQFLIVITLAMIMLGGLGYGFQTSQNMAEFRGKKIGEDILKRVKGLRTSRVGLRAQTMGAGALAGAAGRLNSLPKPVKFMLAGPLGSRLTREAARGTETLKYRAKKFEKETLDKRTAAKGKDITDQFKIKLDANTRKKTELQARVDIQTEPERKTIARLEKKERDGTITGSEKVELANARTQKETKEKPILKEVNDQREEILRDLGDLRRDRKMLGPDTARGVLLATQTLNLPDEDLKKVFGKPTRKPDGTFEYQEPDYAAIDRELGAMGQNFSDDFRKRMIHALDKILKPLENEDGEEFKKRVKLMQENMLKRFSGQDIENLSRNVFDKDQGGLQELILKNPRLLAPLMKDDRLRVFAQEPLRARAEQLLEDRGGKADWFLENNAMGALSFFATNPGMQIAGGIIGGYDIQRIQQEQQQFQNRDQIQKTREEITNLRNESQQFEGLEEELKQLGSAIKELGQQYAELQKPEGMFGGVELKGRTKTDKLAEIMTRIESAQTSYNQKNLEFQQNAEKREKVNAELAKKQRDLQNLTGGTRRRRGGRNQNIDDEGEEETAS